MDQTVLEPVLKKHNLVAFLINLDWILIRRKAYIDVFIRSQPYNSVQVLKQYAHGYQVADFKSEVKFDLWGRFEAAKVFFVT